METKTLDDRVSRKEEAREYPDAEADREDLSLAEKALEEYEAEGIEGSAPYREYREKRLGAAS